MSAKLFTKKYRSESIKMPAKPYNPNLHFGTPLWEEEVNDPTGRAIGWLSLFNSTEGQYLVEYRDLVKRKALLDAAEAKATKAIELAKAQFEAENEPVEIRGVFYHPISQRTNTVEVDGEQFTVVNAGDRGYLCDPHHTSPAEWIYDITDNMLGKFIIAAWKSLNPEKDAALPKTPEEHVEWVHKLAAEDAALLAEERSVQA